MIEKHSSMNCWNKNPGSHPQIQEEREREREFDLSKKFIK